MDENGRTREYVCESHGVTQLTRTASRRRSQGGHEDPRHGLAVPAQPLHVLLRQRRVRGRPHAERQRSARARRGRGAGAAQGHLRHLAARADREPEHERPAADDAVPDAGRREGRRRIRSVQGRSDIPLRSGRDSPRLGRAGHAARNRARRQRHRAASRVDGRAAYRAHEHEVASEERPAQLARPFDRPHGRRHARDRDRELLRGRAEPIRRATGPADAGDCCTRRRSRRSNGCTSTPRVSGSSSRSISWTPNFSRSRSRVRPTSTRHRI